jgi:hypothetical protein
MTRDDCISYLVSSKGWSEPAARGIVAHLDLSSTRSMVPTARWDRYCDHCSSLERSKEYISSALAFLDYELRNSFERVGRALDKATTAEAAAAEVAAYFGRDGARWLTLEEAKATGYVDQGNPELRKRPTRI